MLLQRITLGERIRVSEPDITTTTPTDFDTIEALAPSWYLSLRSRGRSPRTIQGYKLAAEQLSRYLQDTGMPIRVSAIKREHVEAYIVYMLDNRAAATARQRYASLQQFFKWLLEEGEITRNPMERMQPPTVDQPVVPILTDDELRQLITASRIIGANQFEKRRDEAILRLFIDTGARLGEVARMKLDDVDFELGIVVIPKAKGRRARTVPFGRKTATALDRYIRRRRRHWATDEPWFWLGRGGQLRDSGLAQVIARVGNEAGLGRVNPHRFRHTMAHRWLADGGQEGDLMMVGGWKDRQMLSRYGSSAAESRAREAHHRHGLGDKL